VSYASRRIMKRLLIVLIMVSLTLMADGSRHGEGHQDPCHRLHSCPSDHQTYVCGDRGWCQQCPDNQYCLAGKPRVAASPAPAPVPPAPTSTRYPPLVGRPYASPQEGTVQT
jgi:hypothetical protein